MYSQDEAINTMSKTQFDTMLRSMVPVVRSSMILGYEGL